jgi:ATP-GRASP peptide maturase of grasp-with-spasm system
LEIPETIITSQKSDVIQFQKMHSASGIITKAISDALTLQQKDDLYMAFTEEVGSETLDLIPELFYPSLFQRKVKKLFDVRIFFLQKKYFPMAIFSQKSSQTKVDFRKYNLLRPNRTVPFSLPNDVRNKLIKLMKKLMINSGSIDLVYGADGKYYFLEINPVGQFGMVSLPCNYYIEKYIASNL